MTGLYVEKTRHPNHILKVVNGCYLLRTPGQAKYEVIDRTDKTTYFDDLVDAEEFFNIVATAPQIIKENKKPLCLTED